MANSILRSKLVIRYLFEHSNEKKQVTPKKIINDIAIIFNKDIKKYNDFQKEISDIQPLEQKHYIKVEYKVCVYNALCLVHFLKNTKIRELFSLIHNKKSIQPIINVLREQASEQYLQFFCLGIKRTHIELIIDSLNNPDFNIWTDYLPSPFYDNENKEKDLRPLLFLYANDQIDKINWAEYMTQYKNIEKMVNRKEINKALIAIEKLQNNALIRLPVLDSLKKRIELRLKEAQSAIDYIKRFKNS